MKPIMLWIIVAGMLLAACGGIGDPDAVSADDFELSQTISAVSILTGTIITSYPKDWYARAAGGEITFANSQEALQAAGNPVSGQTAGMLLPFPDMLMPSQLAVEAGVGVDVVLRQFIAGLTAGTSERSSTFGSAETFTSKGLPAAMAAGTITQDQTTVNAVAAVVRREGGYVAVLIVAAGGDSRSLRGLVRGMVNTVEYTPPPA